MRYYDLKKEIQGEVLSRIDIHLEGDDAAVSELIETVILEKGKEHYISTIQKMSIKQEVFNAIRRLDLLQELIEDDSITEIMVNGAEAIYYERDGRLVLWDKHFESIEKLEDVIQQIVARANRHVNESSPIVDTGLEDGSRVNVVLKPVAINGPILTIRKFAKVPITMERLIMLDAISEEAVAFLEKLVVAGYNIFISGSTGSGKTTLLNALANFVPKDERIVTIEDSAELQIQGVENLVKLEVRNANTEGENEVTIRDLIKTSLRMWPNRIIVGEVRGPEVIDMLQAMNTGHDGSLSSGHSNSVSDMISRLETMILMGMDIPLAAIRKQIASSIDIIVHLGRLRDKTRRVLEIVEVEGYADGEIKLNSLFEFKEEITGTNNYLAMETGEYSAADSFKVMGHLQNTGNKLKNQRKLQAAALSLE